MRVAIARFISRSGGEAAFFVGIWGKATFDLGATPGQLALLMGVLGLVALAGSAVAGVLIDRFDPRRVLLVGEVFFVPAAFLPILSDTMLELTVAVAVMDAFTMLVFTAISSMPPYLTEDESRLGDVNAAVEAGGNLAFVAGPAIGALIVHVASIDWIFAFDALTSVVAVAVVIPVSLRAMPSRDRHSAFQDARGGFMVVYSKRRLRLLVALGTLTWMSFGAFGALEPLFYRDVLATGPEALGVVNSIFGAGLMAGSVALIRLPKRLLTARTAVVGAMASGLCAFLYTGTGNIRIVVLGAVVWGVVLGMFFPLLRTLTQWSTPAGLYGRVTATAQMHHHTAELLPLTFAPVLAAAFGVQKVLIGSGVAAFLLAATTWREARRLDGSSPPGRVAPDGFERAEPGPVEPADKPVLEAL